jgi:WD40-like Beta Propeller Repeat
MAVQPGVRCQGVLRMRAHRVFVLTATVTVAFAAGAQADAAHVTGWTSRIGAAASGGDPDLYSHRPAISAEGRYVVFESGASNLVPGDTNGVLDVFVRDTRTGVTSRVSLTSAGGQIDRHSHSAAISADGRYVAFTSHGTNILPGDANRLGNVYVRDRVAGTTLRAGPPAMVGDYDNNAATPSISADGRYVSYGTYAALVPTDTNGTADIYVWARETGALERISVSVQAGTPTVTTTRPTSAATGATWRSAPVPPTWSRTLTTTLATCTSAIA